MPPGITPDRDAIVLSGFTSGEGVVLVVGVCGDHVGSEGAEEWWVHLSQ